MNQKERMGYEISIEFPNKESKTFCVDDTGKVRGAYVNGLRHYFSDYELWVDWEGLGIMEGDFKIGGKVSAFDRNGKILVYDNCPVRDLQVRDIREVDISIKVSDPCIAGLDKPIWKPNYLN